MATDPSTSESTAHNGHTCVESGPPYLAAILTAPPYESSTMRLPILSAALAAICLALPATAQVQVFGGDTTRADSSLVLFGDDLVAGINVTHGQPIWKAEYTDMLDKLKGKTHRLGKNLWTTFMTSVPLKIGGTKVKPGSYVVALKCDKAGNFSLAMINANKAMRKGLMPFTPNTWKPDVVTPLKLNKNVAKESVSKMLMSLRSNKADPMTGSFTLAWGPHTLTADLKIIAVKKAEKQDSKGTK